MPEFLSEYIRELQSKAERIRVDFAPKLEELKKTFEKYWVNFTPINCKPDFNVLAVDSSAAKLVTSNGGIFYIVRGLGLSKNGKYRRVFADFEYSPESTYFISNIISRMMEWIEHLIIIEAVENGFDGFILIDGSIYGRMAHIPMEIKFSNRSGFLLDYFETLANMLSICRKHKIPLIGISKESRTSFFREFLIKEILINVEGIDEYFKRRLLFLALDNRRKAVEEAEKTGNSKIIELINELVKRKPDFQLILSCAKSSGYTSPLLLGASQRWRREYKRIAERTEEFVISRFPMLSRNEDFLKKAVKVARNILDFPAIVSFHLLPAVQDTPMRIDVPAWYFGIEKRLWEVGWPELVNIDLDEILRLISAGYCGLDNYNIWLTAVDSEVKLSREVFENLYLPKFEDIVGRLSTPRGYRRVRYP